MCKRLRPVRIRRSKFPLLLLICNYFCIVLFNHMCVKSKDQRTILMVHYPEEELGFALFIRFRFYGRRNFVYCTEVIATVFALLSACSQSFSVFRLCLLLQSGLECVKNGSSPESYSKCNFETSFCNVWKC